MHRCHLRQWVLIIFDCLAISLTQHTDAEDGSGEAFRCTSQAAVLVTGCLPGGRCLLLPLAQPQGVQYSSAAARCLLAADRLHLPCS